MGICNKASWNFALQKFIKVQKKNAKKNLQKIQNWRSFRAPNFSLCFMFWTILSNCSHLFPPVHLKPYNILHRSLTFSFKNVKRKLTHFFLKNTTSKETVVQACKLTCSLALLHLVILHCAATGNVKLGQTNMWSSNKTPPRCYSFARSLGLGGQKSQRSTWLICVAKVFHYFGSFVSIFWTKKKYVPSKLNRPFRKAQWTMFHDSRTGENEQQVGDALRQSFIRGDSLKIAWVIQCAWN